MNYIDTNYSGSVLSVEQKDTSKGPMTLVRLQDSTHGEISVSAFRKTAAPASKLQPGQTITGKGAYRDDDKYGRKFYLNIFDVVTQATQDTQATEAVGATQSVFPWALVVNNPEYPFGD